MASATKEYKIVINGIKESIDEVKILTNMLDELDSRIKNLESRKINISVPTVSVQTTGNESGKNAELGEQSKLLQQIEATEQRIAEARTKDYQELIRLKDELKQVKNEQDSAAASAKLMENSYAQNTMAGLKEQLKDIKRVLNETEIGSDMFNQLTADANELNEKLKEIEKSYGQFGRNVGNYASAAEGFKGLKIQVGDVTREFDSAKEALKQLKNERDTLAMMGEDFHDIDIAVKQLQSSLKDLNTSSSFMDNMLDNMQSIVAIASTAKGIGAIFGKDNDKIEETIKKLVALQNVLQGLEAIQKQMQTNEGIGKWLATGNNAINKFSTNLFGAKKAVEGVAAAEKSATLASKAFGVALKGLGIGLIITLIVSLTKNWDKINAAINKSIPSLEKFGGVLCWLEGLFNSLINVMGSAIEVLYKLIQGDFSGAWGAITEAWNSGFQEVVDDRVREEKAAAAESLKIEMDLLEAKYGEEVKYTQKYKQLLDQRNKLLRESINPNTDEGKNALRQQEIEEEKEKKAYKDHAKEMARLQKESDQELTNLRISNMKEGLNKTLIQLEEERKAKIAKARETGRNVREIEAEINKEYDRKELEAREEYAKKVQEVYKNLLDSIRQLQAQEAKETLANMETELDNTLNSMMQGRMNIIGEGFGTGWGKKRTMPELFTYGTDMKLGTLIDEETIKKAEEYREILNNVYHALNEVSDAEQQAKDLQGTDESGVEYYKKEAETLRKEYEKALEAKKAFEEANSENIGRIYYAADDKKIDENIFKKRMEILDEFYKNYLDTAKESQEKILEQRKVSLEREEYLELRALSDRAGEFMTQLKEARKLELQGENVTEAKKLEIREKYRVLHEQYMTAYENEKKAIQDKYNKEEIKAEQETNQKIQSINEEHWQDMLQQLRDFQSVASKTASKNPVYNSWGIYNFSANKKNFDDARTQYDTLLNDLSKRRQQLNQDWKDGIISDEAFETTGRELDRMVESTTDALAQIEEDASQGFPRFMESIQQYVQAFSQTLSSVLDALWASQDAAYEKEMEDIDKDLEELEKKLDKQKELVQDYANNVDSIEDELSTARGDRRQELIDQLNAEKAAQREALREQQRIEKEQEKLKEKQEKLEKEQKKRQKQRDITSALINSAMAVSYALANPWPFPAVALAAAAAIQGAAQVAAIKAQKYATGGIIEGKSHAHGGVKVLGGTAEVEGGEFITNKYTTAKNAQLLEFINGKKKKIYLEDIIDFYTDGRMKRNIISASPNRRYADGGQLPTLRTDININNRILDAIESVANRPSYVSVVEIEDVSQSMRSVRAQAGLTE